MSIVLDDLGGLASEQERKAIEKVINGTSVTAYAIFDADGAAVEKSGVSDTAVAVFSSICDLANPLGQELGERDPRPAVMFSSKLMEILALPMQQLNVLVVKDKTASKATEFAHVS